MSTSTGWPFPSLQLFCLSFSISQLSPEYCGWSVLPCPKYFIVDKSQNSQIEIEAITFTALTIGKCAEYFSGIVIVFCHVLNLFLPQRSERILESIYFAMRSSLTTPFKIHGSLFVHG